MITLIREQWSLIVRSLLDGSVYLKWASSFVCDNNSSSWRHGLIGYRNKCGHSVLKWCSVDDYDSDNNEEDYRIIISN